MCAARKAHIQAGLFGKTGNIVGVSPATWALMDNLQSLYGLTKSNAKSVKPKFKNQKLI